MALRCYRLCAKHDAERLVSDTINIVQAELVAESFGKSASFQDSDLRE